MLTSKFESLSKLFAEEAGKVIDSTVEKLKHQQGITTAFQDLFIRSTQLTQKVIFLIKNNLFTFLFSLSLSLCVGCTNPHQAHPIKQVQAYIAYCQGHRWQGCRCRYSAD